MKNDFIINCSDQVFDKSREETKISGQPVVLNASTAQAVSDAEILDRYDDFAELKISKNLYKNVEGNEYGIPYIREIHGTSGGVVLPHQINAAKGFLHDLRGFGLLADVVGSGKTFEAGIVLSELAARGKLKSLLLVVPEQVYSNWINVLEKYFGMGKGVLEEIGDEPFFSGVETVTHGNTEMVRPKRPVIVKAEDFVKWRENDIKNLLFDVVVVDEAHHLCSEEGENAKALKFLSILMLNKKLMNSTYCLLLSATPHSGNLDKMFRLWYFIRCKGGYPEDFDEKEDEARTKDYITEKQYYLDVVCRGAHTVSEYIAVSKKLSIEQRFAEEFYNYLTKTNVKNFESLTDWEKQKVREEFLHDPENERICNIVLDDVARGYHNGVMRSIMIRQENNLSKKRNVTNIFICPVEKELPKKIAFDGIKINPYDPEGEKGVESSQGDTSLTEYLESCGQNNARRRAEIWMSQVFGPKVFENKRVFEKEESQTFYWQQIQDTPSKVTKNEYRILNNYSASTAKKAVLDIKLKEITRILNNYNDERILIFFDYEKPYTKADGPEWVQLYNALQNTPHKDRLCLALGDNIKASEKFFRETSNAVFIIGDPAYTEGSNYQESRVVINFSVTPDPLAMDQRIGRIFRLGQKRDVEIFSLAVMNDLEGYALAYFNRIGLLSSNSGDATIIAGSNNERMVAVQCPACGKMLLYPSDEFATRKMNNDLYCNETERCCLNDTRGTMMQEINIYEFKCDKCGEILSRNGEEGYRCFAISSGVRGKLVNVVGTREYTCSKLCAIRHCNRIKNFKTPCKLLEDLSETVGIAAMKLICLKCQNRKDGLCHPECTLMFDSPTDALSHCKTCDYSSCRPKPHSFKFDDKWTAPCPKDHCGGHLRPVLAHTFAAYIKASFAFNDGGRSFCRNLMQEANHVADIRNVLERDKRD